MGVDEGRAAVSPAYGSEVIAPVVHQALHRLGRAREAAVLAHAVKTWVDAGRTDFMSTGLRHKYAGLLADARGQRKQPPVIPDGLEEALRHTTLELKLARALGLAVPDELRDLAADLLQLISSAPPASQ